MWIMNEKIIRNMSSLAVTEPGKKILDAVEETMGRLDPSRIVRDFLSFFSEGDIPEDVRIIGFGKASAKMMAGALEVLRKPVYAGHNHSKRNGTA
ncbi:MAG: GckA/TtuD-like protein [Thermoplasmatales archaeon A-plasma]|nr:MAG: GckA/TtuD-like protein [Thermoplasmatales archaeon A-plasma]